MTGFIGGAGGSSILERDDQRLRDAVFDIAPPVLESFRSQWWPRGGNGGLDGGILAAVAWADFDQLPRGVHSPSAGASAPVSGTVLVRLDRGALIEIEGLDAAEVHVDLDSQQFQGSPTVRQVFTVGPNPLDPFNPNQALVTPLAVGSATLHVRADGAPGPGVAPLELDIPVRIYELATALAIFVSVDGGAEIRYTGTGNFTVPIGKTAALRLEGINGAGEIVPVASKVLCVGLGCVGSSRFHLVQTGDGTYTLIPDSVGIPDADVQATADADIGPDSTPLLLLLPIEIVPAVATHIGATAAAYQP